MHDNGLPYSQRDLVKIAGSNLSLIYKSKLLIDVLIERNLYTAECVASPKRLSTNESARLSLKEA